MDVNGRTTPGDAQDTQLTYVMIRIRRHSGEFGRWTGMAEHLGTAEKRGFIDGNGLLRLIEEWSAGLSAERDLAERGEPEQAPSPGKGTTGR